MRALSFVPDPTHGHVAFQFLDSSRVTVLPITADTADRYALIYAVLRRAGTPIPTHDLWIAAHVLSESGAAQ